MSEPATPEVQAPGPEGAAAAPPKPRRIPVRRLLMFAVPVLLLLVGGYFWLTAGRYASTDNAYIKQDMVSVAAEVSGRISDIAVGENQHVKQGDLLFRIDPEAYHIALQQAEGAVSAAQLQVEQMRATYHSAEASLKAAQDNLDYAQKVFNRYQQLVKTGTASRSQFDEAENNLRTAGQTLASAQQTLIGARAALNGDPAIPTDQHPLVRQAIAQRDKATLDVQHAELRAPADGVVSQTDRLQPGQYVAVGTAVLAIVETRGTWIEANFKETDLTHMRPGQPVDISLDAYPGLDLKGQVASIGAGTGSEFSLIPAQNATGNWVKVVQRVPVRIKLESGPDVPLRSGLSASVSVDTGYVRPALAMLLGGARGVAPVADAMAQQ